MFLGIIIKVYQRIYRVVISYIIYLVPVPSFHQHVVPVLSMLFKSLLLNAVENMLFLWKRSPNPGPHVVCFMSEIAKDVLIDLLSDGSVIYCVMACEIE